MKNLPNQDLKVTKDTVICENHWEKNYATKPGKWNKERPMNPPSVFPGVSRSPSPTPRPTKRSSFMVRNPPQPDQMEEFLLNDRIKFPTLVERVLDEKTRFTCPTISYMSDNCLHIQASSFQGGYEVHRVPYGNKSCGTIVKNE